MNTTDILLILLLLGIGAVIYLFLRPKEEVSNENKFIEENAYLKAELSQKDQKLGELTQELQSEKTKKDELAGKNKQLFAEKTTLKAESDSTLKEKERLAKDLSKFQAEEDRKKKELENMIQKLNVSTIALDDEKKRVRKEDEERDKREKDERDRMWAEHEENVKAQLVELCKLPQYNFQTYDNKNLPEGFGGKLKPDFMIEFLGQYVIFDAKMSKSDNLQNYVNTNVKTTAEKIQNNPKIYPTVFFVVPIEAMQFLTKTHFHEQRYEFFIISPDAIPVLLSTFRKLSAYELAEQMDPRDRENIVNLIAEFDHHINMRNALDLLSSQSGVSVLSKVNNLKKDIRDEISLKKGKMRVQHFSPTDIKTFMIDTQVQQNKIEELTAPKAQIPAQEIHSVSLIFEEDGK